MTALYFSIQAFGWYGTRYLDYVLISQGVEVAIGSGRKDAARGETREETRGEMRDAASQRKENQPARR